jgi:hypothetical protein
MLYDVPLAKYRGSAALLGAGGRRVPLRVSTFTSAVGLGADIEFDARPTLATPVPQVTIHDTP